ncbi:MAG: TIGR00282 family metallophosphoesterase [bacterium]
MNILFIGDVVGRPGRRILNRLLPELMEEHNAQLVVVNTENAAGGFGMSQSIHDQMVGMGVDVLTTGNHVWDRREFIKEIEHCERVLRPANYPPGVPGKGWIVIETDYGPAAVINLSGRVFMPPVDCPFRKAREIIEEIDHDVKVVIIDFHAEATSEKQALARFLDGEVTAVAGTHTHIQTADETVFPGGTAFICDLGMTGPAQSVIGVKIEPILDRFLSGLPKKFDTATGAEQINGAVITCDPKTGKATAIKRINKKLEE